MPGLSDYMENAVLNSMLRGVAFPSVTGSVYVALWIGDPLDDASGGAEVSTSGTAYARVAISRATGSWAAPSNSSGSQQTTNSAAVSFATATANWGTVTHMALFDAATAGNMLASAPLGTSRNILSGDPTPTFPISALVVAIG